MKKPVVVMLGPDREAVSGVSTHLNILFASRLAKEYSLVHFRVGSEGRPQRPIKRMTRLVTSPLRLAAAILTRGAAIVHINTSLNARAYWRDLCHLLVARACGARVLFQVHGGMLPLQFFSNSRLLTAFLRWTMSLPDALVVLASVELEAYRNFVRQQQTLMLPNGIDYFPYAKRLRARSDPSLPLRLVYMGRLAKEKGLYELLEGLRLARDEGSKAELVIAGTGPEQEALRRFVHDAGLDATVSFAGPVLGANKSALFADSDVFVLASYAEGMPYALLESMAAGVPAIVTRVGAIPDVVEEGIHGLFVPLQDATAIAQAIARLANERDLLAQMGAACRKQIARNYTAERVAGDLCRLYSELFEGKHTKALRRS
jgi:glycosyltransferase involved in cell wall biosynthesis